MLCASTLRELKELVFQQFCCEIGCNPKEVEAWLKKEPELNKEKWMQANFGLDSAIPAVQCPNCNHFLYGTDEVLLIPGKVGGKQISSTEELQAFVAETKAVGSARKE